MLSSLPSPTACNKATVLITILPVMAADLVIIATTAVLSQFLGPRAKHFGELMLERGKQIGSKAVAMLAAIGRELQAVEPKVLLC